MKRLVAVVFAFGWVGCVDSPAAVLEVNVPPQPAPAQVNVAPINTAQNEASVQAALPTPTSSQHPTSRADTGPTGGEIEPMMGPVGTPQPFSGSVAVSNAEAVIARLRPGFRSCYNKGLERDPKMQGAVKITTKVGPNGKVFDVVPDPKGSLSPEVIDCLKKRINSVQFEPPGDGGSTIQIPIMLDGTM